MTPAVKPLKLSKTYKDLKAGTKCLVAGWGITANRQRERSDTLREVNVSVINRRDCNDRKHYNSNPPVTMNMVCAGDKNGKKDSCMVTILFTHSVHQQYRMWDFMHHMTSC